MYLPRQFEETRVELVHGLLRSYPFGMLVTTTAEGPCVDHLPFHLAPEPAPLGTLRGHVARANPVWQQLVGGAEALAVFRGPNAYISPSWYPSKRVHGKVVPTWNYVVAHAHGVARAVEDATWLRALVEDLTDAQEASSAVPWRVDDAPREFTDQMLQAIVGIEMPIRQLLGKCKVSQNRAEADRQGVVAGLTSMGDTNSSAMAQWVRDVTDS